MTVREIFRFFDKLPLFLAKMTGTKILNLAEECIRSNEFLKALYTAAEAQNFFMVDSGTQRIWMVVWWCRIWTEFLFRVLASHQHSIFSFPQVRLYSAYSILMSQPPYCILWVLIAFVRSWEKNSYSDSWIHHVHYRRSLLKIFLRKEYVL